MRDSVKVFTYLIAGCCLALESAAFPLQANDRTKIGENSPPFSAGERLVFRVEWNPPWYLFFLPTMEAGEAELSLAEVTQFEEKKALKIVFKARSSGTLVRLAGVTIDDHMEFVTDPETLCTFSVAKKIREGKRKRDIDVVYLPEKRQLHIRETDVAISPPKVKRDETVTEVPECVKDLFSALYSVRRTDISPGFVHRTVIGDNARVKEVEIRVENSEIVQTPSGRYQAWKINTIALLGGLFKDGGEFKIWLTADERKMPVRFEAKVSLGKVSGRLKSTATVIQ